MLISTSSYIFLVRLLATFGSAVLAGYVVSIRIVLFILLPSWGLSNAAATLVGQNLGADKPDRAARSVWITGLWNMGFMAIVTVTFLSFAEPIIHFFMTDPESAPTGIRAHARHRRRSRHSLPVDHGVRRSAVGHRVG